MTNRREVITLQRPPEKKPPALAGGEFMEEAPGLTKPGEFREIR
jgi:hypothetical protein